MRCVSPTRANLPVSDPWAFFATADVRPDEQIHQMYELMQAIHNREGQGEPHS